VGNFLQKPIYSLLSSEEIDWPREVRKRSYFLKQEVKVIMVEVLLFH